MVRYILWRLAWMVVILFGVGTIVFLMMNTLPGDPAKMLVSHFGASAKDIEILRQQLGLDDPMLVRYGRFVMDAVQGDLGQSFHQKRSVNTILKEGMPSTFRLALLAMVTSAVLGVIVGVSAAVRRGSWTDTLIMLLSLIGISVPTFWLGLMLMLLFAVTLKWLPALGGEGWQGIVLPALTLALPSSAIVARLTRSSMLDVLQEDFVRTARAKGLAERLVIYRHTLRNALIPVVTMTGLQFGYLLGGSVVVEMLFSRQGLGQLVVNAVFARDIPVVQGWCLLVAVSYGVVNLLVDLSYAAINPMIRYDTGH